MSGNERLTIDRQPADTPLVEHSHGDRLRVFWHLDMEATRVFFSWKKGGRVVSREDYSMTGLAHEIERRRLYGGVVPIAFHKALIALTGIHSAPAVVRH